MFSRGSNPATCYLLCSKPNFYYADIGSNIGAYTLASRAMGNPVISVDMDQQNHALLYNSLGKDNNYILFDVFLTRMAIFIIVEP